MTMLSQLSDFKPDADSVTPLYMQLANKLSSGITSGDWRANEALARGINVEGGRLVHPALQDMGL
jgi:hypothetical protein